MHTKYSNFTSESTNSKHLTSYQKKPPISILILHCVWKIVETLKENLTCQIQPGNIEDVHGKDASRSFQKSGPVEENVCIKSNYCLHLYVD